MIPIVDLFAGPGGLNEGFSSIGEQAGRPVFQTVASFEMNPYAHGTLVLRTAYRIMKREGGVPQSYYRYIQGMLAWEDFTADPVVGDALSRARSEAHLVELGESNRVLVDGLIQEALGDALGEPSDDWVLIGGPPYPEPFVALRDALVSGDADEVQLRQADVVAAVAAVRGGSLTHLKAGIAARGFGASPVRSAVAPVDEPDAARIRDLAAVIADAPAGDLAKASVLGAV